MSYEHELLGLAITTPRYLLAMEMAERVKKQESILLPMSMFIAADVADGMIMRHIGGGAKRLPYEE
ncbi:hypothetical protein KBC77_00835 [Candidatus Saccharibacteria bacterium]|nr:hypothetical protein [Candidatus Saccharibacteria bacterium]